MKHKNKVLIIVGSVLLVLVVAYLAFMYIPQKIVTISPSDVSSIKIGNGNTGRQITVTEQNDIDHIISNLNSISFRRDKLAAGYVGFSYDMTIYTSDEIVYKKLVVNSTSTIRYGAYLCKDKTNSIDYDYIGNLFVEDVKISADYEENVDLSGFSAVYRLTEDRTDNYGYGVVLWFDQTVKDFTVTLMYNDTISNIYTDKEVLFVLPLVERGQAVVLVTYIPEIIPKTKISFNSVSGNQDKRMISWSGENGDVLLLDKSSGLEF